MSGESRNHIESATGRDHWLVRPATIRKLWWIFGAVLALTVAAQFFVHVHGYFGIDKWPGFNAGYGFLACVAHGRVRQATGLFAQAAGRLLQLAPEILAGGGR